MLTKVALLATGFVAVGSLAVFGLAAAAPERLDAQSFFQRVASGAASLMMRGIAAGYNARNPSDAAPTGPVIVRVDFKAEGDLTLFAERMDGFAPFLSNVPGLVWKVWALDEDTREASGTYLFERRRQADMYLSDILPEGMGNVPYISGTTVQVTPVMVGPSQVTHAPLTEPANAVAD